MKILFILELFKPHVGGVEVLFDHLIHGLIARGHTVTVLTSQYDKGLPRYEKNENLEIFRVGHNRYDFMLYCLWLGVKLARKSDIIHATTYNAAVPSWIIARLTGKKVVITVHEVFLKLWYRFMGPIGFFFKLYERFIFLLPFDRYLSVSNYTKNSIRLAFGIPDEKLRTVYNGIDYGLWNRSNFTRSEELRKKLGGDRHFLGLFFGRPGISKGLEFYIRAIPEIIKSTPDFLAILLVPESKNNPVVVVRRLIAELRIEEYVRMLPSVPIAELGNYILASDVVVIPSLVEGFGFAAAEVCALEKELIVTNTAALPEVVSGKIHFVEPGNPSHIARAFEDVRSGKFDTIPRKEFFWSENIENTERIYREII